ncbi:MAG: phosphate transport system regulatory protein PhoU [Proteobacteria bacterium]|nr:MAG: phosphate transport system regulatory protein PhoU [Pseudomonadota bacterium]
MNQPIYEKRLQRDYRKIIKMVAAVSTDIEKSLKNSLHALLNRDTDLAYQTILGDNPINRQISEIDKKCHYFVARHLPSAGHLRFISSVLRINIGLERIGDYAVTISRETAQLSKPINSTIRRELEYMARDSFQMFNQALKAFTEQNADLAKGTMAFADNIDHTFSIIFSELVQKGEKDVFSVQDLFSILVVLNQLERISDQAKNICEETVFSVTGQMKKKRPVKVLFLDKTNDLCGPMATQIARKAFPESGIYQSAGSCPAEQVRPDVIEFMDQNGYNLSSEVPDEFQLTDEELSEYEVIVCLRGDYSEYVSQIPFHSVGLNWKLPEPPDENASEDERKESYTRILKHLVEQINTLMTTMRGEEAS